MRNTEINEIYLGNLGELEVGNVLVNDHRWEFYVWAAKVLEEITLIKGLAIKFQIAYKFMNRKSFRLEAQTKCFNPRKLSSQDPKEIR